MSKIRKIIKLPQPELLKGKVSTALINYLRQLTDAITATHKRAFGHAEGGGTSTVNWNIREATALDVTNGVATAAGNLLIEHKINGTKREIQQ